MRVKLIVSREQVIQAVLSWISQAYPTQYAIMADIEVLPEFDQDENFDGVIVSGNPIV